MRQKVLSFILLMTKAQKLIRATLSNLRMRYTITKNAFIEEYKVLKEEIKTSPVDADKILEIQMETYDWDLTDYVIKKFLQRCRSFGILQYL